MLLIVLATDVPSYSLCFLDQSVLIFSSRSLEVMAIFNESLSEPEPMICAFYNP